MKALALMALLMLASSPALAKKDCNELKSEIEGKIKAKGVKSFTLEVVAGDAKGDGKVVGTCDGGAKKIVYKKG